MTKKWVKLEKQVKTCENCLLCRGRTNTVFGEGNKEAEIVICGEGPGADEDKTGRPFVGKAGQLLDQLLTKAGLKREDVYILNSVKCRPPGNRRPKPNEIQACKPYLEEQLLLINPVVIIALGNVALEVLTGIGTGITRRCGVMEYYQPEKGKDIPVYPCFHPSFLLRSPEFTEKSVGVIRQARMFTDMVRVDSNKKPIKTLPPDIMFSDSKG